MKDTIVAIPYVLLAIWFLFSIYYLIRAKRTPHRINPYIFETIPQVFPTLGILGTFLGIAYGLFYFDVKDMNNSIPELRIYLQIFGVIHQIGIIQVEIIE